MRNQGTKRENLPAEMTTQRRFIPLKEKRPVYREWQKPENWRLLHEIPRGAACGYVLTGSGLFCLDFDKALDDNGNCKPGVKEILQKCQELASGPTYTETSMSGTGIHIFYKIDKLPDNAPFMKKIPGPLGSMLEVYTGKSGDNKGKQIALTGSRIGPVACLADGDKVLLYLLNLGMLEAKQGGENVKPDNHKGNGESRPTVETYFARMPEELANLNRAGDAAGSVEFIRQHLRSARQEFLFPQLFDDGDIEAYGGDHSSADLALMNLLPFWTGGNAAMMTDIFKLSALAKDLDRKGGHEADYLQRTIRAALKSWNGTVYGQETLLNLPLTDEGNAHRLALLYGDRLKWCSGIGKWMLYTGHVWEEVDQEHVYVMADKAMHRTKGEWQKAGMDEKGLKFFTNCTNLPKTKAMLEKAKGLLPAKTKDFDRNPWLLNCQNGVVNLKTGTIYPQSPERMQSKICSAALPPAGTTSPLWEQTIRQIVPDDDLRHYLQKYIGYCLTGSTREENFLIMHGPGGTGKGTFIETIQKVLGSYARPVNVDMFLSYRNDANSGENATPILAALENIRLVVASESGEGRKFNEAKIKLLTGGDTITARRLHQAPITYQPAFKVIIQTNYIPDVSNVNDKGITRRMLIAPFRQGFTEEQRNLKLKEELAKPTNRNAVLRWCVDGCLMWQKEGLTGTEPAIMNQLRDKYLNDRDYIGDFLKTFCQYKTDSRAYLKDLYTGFCEWYGSGEKTAPVTRKRFSAILRERLDDTKTNYTHTKRGYAFNGISFSLEELAADDDVLK